MSWKVSYMGLVLRGLLPFFPFIYGLIISFSTSLGSNIVFPGAPFLLKMNFFSPCLLLFTIDLHKHDY